MSMRDQIAEIISSGARWRDKGQYVLADAILAALPDYDKQQARIEELEASLAKAMVVLKLISGDDWEARLGEAIDISCEILAENMEDDE
jgi:nicotinamide riboside kinase